MRPDGAQYGWSPRAATGVQLAETRRRILDVARQSFAELGYGGTTNRHIATKAGITTGALYHYFDSKLDLYLAVQQYVDEVAFGPGGLAAHVPAAEVDERVSSCSLGRRLRWPPPHRCHDPS